MADESTHNRRHGFFIRDRPHTPAGSVTIALFGGALLGVIAWWLHGVLPQPWNTLTNTSALWGLVAAAAVLVQRARGTLALVTGVAALLGMTVAFAVLDGASAREFALYLSVGVVAGALFGLAASVAGSSRRLHQLFACAVLGGIVAGEGLYGVVIVDAAGPQWWLELALGLLIAALIGRGWRGRILAVGTAATVSLALLGAYALYDTLMAA